MRTLRLLALVALLAGTGQAQFLGYVALQTTRQNNVFSAQAANGDTVTFNDIGQSTHSLSYCNTNFVGTINLVASPDATFSPAIPLASATYLTADSNCHVLQAGGWYPAVRGRITNYSAGSVTAHYSGAGGPVAVNPAAISSGGPGSPIVCDQVATGHAGSNTTVQIIPAPPLATQNTYICGFTWSLDGAAAAASIVSLVNGHTANCGVVGTTVWQVDLAAASPLIFSVTQVNLKVPNGTNPLTCVQNNNIGTGVEISISYAQF
jgi:hypothetical protein